MELAILARKLSGGSISLPIVGVDCGKYYRLDQLDMVILLTSVFLHLQVIHYLVSAALLLDEQLLMLEDIADRPDFPRDRVDFGPIINWKKKLLHRSYHTYIKQNDPVQLQEFIHFQHEQSSWLAGLCSIQRS